MTHFSYDFCRPIKRYSLPDQYKEISGLSPLGSNNTLAFVQDEAVQIHLLDLNSGTVTEHAKHDDGDSEDIVITGKTAYLLKAGKQPAIYKVTHFNREDAHCERYNLGLHKDQDPEGLCHDIPHNRLLIACKGSSKKKTKRVASTPLTFNPCRWILRRCLQSIAEIFLTAQKTPSTLPVLPSIRNPGCSTSLVPKEKK